MDEESINTQINSNISNTDDIELRELLNAVNLEGKKYEEECDLLLDLIVQNQYRLLSSSKAFQVTKKNATLSDNQTK